MGRDDRVLWSQARAGDKAARARLIELHMPLARSLAVQYRHAREPLDDLTQVANLGLVKAVDRYEPARGVAFTSFAVPTILGELKRHFRDRTWVIHVSRRIQEGVARVEKATDELRTQLGRYPSAAEVAHATGMTVEEVTEARLADGATRLASLDAPSSAGESPELADQLGRADTELERVENAVWIEQLAGDLTPRQREVLRLRFVEDLVQREIADRVGLSQMHVSRILRETLEQLAEATQPEQRDVVVARAGQRRE
jgi:RNA polymerase sigma-B factor